MAAEYRIDPGHRVVGDAETYPDQVILTGLEAFLGGRQKEIPGPLVRQCVVSRRAGRVHLGQIYPEVLLEQVDAGAGRQGRAADAGRNRDPMPVLPGNIFDALADLAV